jgi:hypothetical protein
MERIEVDPSVKVFVILLGIMLSCFGVALSLTLWNFVKKVLR